MMRALVNGVDSERISITDRGLAYGDGLFETIAVRNGRVCLWAFHLRRLRHGAIRLAIPCPADDLLTEEIHRIIDGRPDCVVKLILTRGPGGRGYRSPVSPIPTRVLSLHPWPEYPSERLKQGVCVYMCRTLLGENPGLAGLKHLNRLEQVLARSEWQDPGVAEGLMRDGRGRVIAGTMSNLFLVSGSRLITPRLDSCGISGTVRELVLGMAAGFDLQTLEEDLFISDLGDADGLFLTNAIIGAWPVKRLGDRTFDLERLPMPFLQAIKMAAHSPDTEPRD